MADSFVARNSRIKTALMLAIVLGLLALTISPDYFGLRPKTQFAWIQWPAIALMGFAAVVFALRLFDDRDLIVVDRNGIMWRQWSDQPIPWSAISAFHIEKQHTRWPFYIRHLCIDLHEPAQHPSTSARAKLFGRGWNLGYGDITVTTIGTETTVDELLEAMERFSAKGSN